MTKKKNESYSYQLVKEYDTSENQEVNDEIEIISNSYENVKVTGKSCAHCKVHIPLISETNPSRRVTLIIAVVPGYPYVAPKVILTFPPGIRPGDENTLSEYEVQFLEKEVKDNIQLCLPSGMPCMMQIVSAVGNVVNFSVLPPAQKRETESVVSPCKAQSAGQSPSLTPVPLMAKEALRLSILTLHLLKKCCHMKDPESNEEANCNFDLLARYLLDKVGVLPRAARGLVPWSGLKFVKAFASDMQSDPSLKQDQQDVLKWMWEDEEQNLRIQQGSEGRYRTEFIQQRLLGSGGFAPVYVCRKKIDGRLYAIKKVVMTESQSEKVLREVQTLAALNHKNIVRYYDAWVEHGCEEELRSFIDSETNEDEEGSSSGSYSGLDSTEGGSSPSSNSMDSTTSYSSSESESNADEGSEETVSINSRSFLHRSKGDTNKLSSSKHYQTLYIQMELCSARSLRHLIDESDSNGSCGIFVSENGEKVAVSILRQLLSVIAHTHRERIVHRDLKPDNVLFEMESSPTNHDIGTIRVADFGLARVLFGVKRNASIMEVDELSVASSTQMHNNITGNCGSVLYCAPEQEKGLEYDFNVDEFSIGMIAFEMWLAIAGKGFRDRFNIMSDVWRSGKLPVWFWKWNPTMADVIEKLVSLDPRRRLSCEAVLSTAELPGDPAEIVSALATLEKYGDRIAGRMIQKIQRMGSKFRKPSRAFRDDTRFIGSSSCTDLAQAINVIGLLHGCSPVAFFDQLVPMNPELETLGVESLVDAGGRCYAHAIQPQLVVASFLGMQENGSIGSFFQFHYHGKPYVTFTTPLSKSEVFNELSLDPLLSLFHLFAFMELTEPMELVLSHAHWLNIVYPREIGSRLPPSALCQLGVRLQTADQIGSAVSNVNEHLSAAGLQFSSERDEYIRKYAIATLDAINTFNKHMNIHVELTIDPALRPSDSLVLRNTLDGGLIFECRSSGTKAPLAFGCKLSNFTSKCTVTNTDIDGLCVAVDAKQLLLVGKHVRMTLKESLLLDGVAVKRHDLYSLAHLSSVIESTVLLWKGNIRAFLRVDTDAHALGRFLKQKQIRWILMDGKRIVSVTLNQQNKMSGRSADIAPEDLRLTVRSLAGKERSSSSAAIGVQFLSGKSEGRVADEICELFMSMMSPAPSSIVAVDAAVEDIKECIEMYNEHLGDGPLDVSCVPTLSHWMRANAATAGVVPVYSLLDGRIVFFVNYKRFKALKTKEKKRKKK